MDHQPRGPWGKVPAYAELARSTRCLAAGSVERRYWYILCRERTPHGTVFFYVKSRVETWEDGRVTGEDFAVQRLPVRDDEQAARQGFRRLTEARAPVSPVHLTDILRDLAVMAGEQPSRWPLAPVERPSPRRRSRPSDPIDRTVPRPCGSRRVGTGPGHRHRPYTREGTGRDEPGPSRARTGRPTLPERAGRPLPGTGAATGGYPPAGAAGPGGPSTAAAGTSG